VKPTRRTGIVVIVAVILVVLLAAVFRGPLLRPLVVLVLRQSLGLLAQNAIGRFGAGRHHSQRGEEAEHLGRERGRREAARVRVVARDRDADTRGEAEDHYVHLTYRGPTRGSVSGQPPPDHRPPRAAFLPGSGLQSESPRHR
jgi:hypothetical protein